MSNTTLTAAPANTNDAFATAPTPPPTATATTATTTTAATTANAAVTGAKNYLSSHKIMLSAIAIGLFGFILGRMSKKGSTP